MNKFLNSFLISCFLAFPSLGGDWSGIPTITEDLHESPPTIKRSYLSELEIENRQLEEIIKELRTLPRRKGSPGEDGTLSPMDISEESRPTSPGLMSLESSALFDLSDPSISPSILDIKHAGIILDGNRRWAKKMRLNPSDGHKKCFLETAPRITHEIFTLNLHTLTLWFFSTANWKRDELEVANLMKYCEGFIDEIMPIARELKIKIIHLGRKDRIPQSLANKIRQAEEESLANDDHVLNLGIDYGGRDEILRAYRKASESNINPQDITEPILEAYLDTASQKYPAPDIIIRTSRDDPRYSGFMLWQSAYCPIHFTDTWAPDLKIEDLLQIFAELQRSNQGI